MSTATLRIDLPNDPKFSICRHARQLIAEGQDPDTLLHVFRNDTLCFNPTRLSTWADLTTTETDRTAIRFARYQPLPPSAFGTKS